MNASTLFILCVSSGLALLAESAITAYFVSRVVGVF